MSNSGIRADGTVRAVTLLKETNYKIWSVKTKAAFFMSECWDVVNDTATMPPDAPTGSTADHVAEVTRANSANTTKFHKAATILINTTGDNQLHSVLNRHAILSITLNNELCTCVFRNTSRQA